MNLAFSTRGWREKDWLKQMEDACEMQFQGIEVYNLHKIDSLVGRGGPFHKYSRNETERMLRRVARQNRRRIAGGRHRQRGAQLPRRPPPRVRPLYQGSERGRGAERLHRERSPVRPKAGP